MSEPDISLDDTLRLHQQVARLQALLEASRQIHATIQLDEVLRAALEIVVRELEMEGVFFTAFPFSHGRIPPRYLLSPPGADLGRGCARFLLSDKSRQPITELVVFPREGMQLTLEESDFIESLAVQTAVAIENARHHERTMHLQRVEQDLASARAIQRSLLPQSIGRIPGYEAAMRSVSCYEVGGDYLDVFPLATGEHMMIVADVAGKGLTSAMVACSFRSAFRAMARTGMPLAEIATQLNDLHYQEGPEARRRYVTALLLRLDPKANTIEALNAGHNPAVLLHGHGKAPVMFECSGTPIGILPGAEYSSETHELGPGARLLAYTDGMTEVFQGEEEFGFERLVETFRSCRLKQGEAVLETIWRTLGEFTSEKDQRDDMTALVLMRH